MPPTTTTEPDPQPTDTRPPEPDPQPTGPAIVVRSNFATMSAEDKQRFFDAVTRMMTNSDGAGTNDYYRIAAIHGQPAPIHGIHGRETFALWHRAHLVDFERRLRLADRALGNDGTIALPYWDFIEHPEIPDEVLRFQSSFDPELFPADARPSSTLVRASNTQVRANIASWNVAGSLNDSFLNEQHWGFASTRFTAPYPSIESVSNDMHVIIGGNGGPMGGVAWCSYDIVYWLVHANIDRIYESYLALEPDSESEFAEFQKMQTTDVYNQALEPFTKPDGSAAFPTDYFNIAELDYSYDTLVTPPPAQ